LRAADNAIEGGRAHLRADQSRRNSARTN
jgi:hypothetical protein